MTLSISISSQAEAKLKDKAIAAGKDLATCASELLEEAAAANSADPHAADSTRSVYDELKPVLEEIWATPLDTPRPPLKGEDAEVERLLLEKFRKQGLKI